jgi:hypothetical protein
MDPVIGEPDAIVDWPDIEWDIRGSMELLRCGRMDAS